MGEEEQDKGELIARFQSDILDKHREIHAFIVFTLAFILIAGGLVILFFTIDQIFNGENILTDQYFRFYYFFLCLLSIIGGMLIFFISISLFLVKPISLFENGLLTNFRRVGHIDIFKRDFFHFNNIKEIKIDTVEDFYVKLLVVSVDGLEQSTYFDYTRNGNFIMQAFNRYKSKNTKENSELNNTSKLDPNKMDIHIIDSFIVVEKDNEIGKLDIILTSSLILLGLYFLIENIIDNNFFLDLVNASYIGIILIGIFILVEKRLSMIIREFRMNEEGLLYFVNDDLGFVEKWDNIKEIYAVIDKNKIPYNISITPKKCLIYTQIDIQSSEKRKKLYERLLKYVKRHNIQIIEEPDLD
jgi:hypothetical protein